MKRQIEHGFALALAAILVVGCAGPDEDELRQWMSTQRREAKPQVTPIADPKPYKPQEYLQGAAMEPTLNLRLIQELQRDTSSKVAGSNLIAPELARRKEPLEGYPLDSMVMVGSLNKAGQRWALIKADNLLYQVQPGQHLGMNNGRIVRITETEIVLREIVQDAGGEWIEKNSTLQLQENKK